MSQMGVYKMYKLARSGNGFSTGTKLGLERDLHVIQNDYAERINAQSNINGLLYEKDEKATKLYLDGKPFKSVKEFVEFEEVEEGVTDISLMTKAELVQFAKDNDFKVDVLAKKEVILDSIIEQSKNQ